MAVSPGNTTVRAQRAVVIPVTDGSGDATYYTTYLTGYIAEIQYVKTDYAAGVDFTITIESTGKSIWTEANIDASTYRSPRCAVHDSVGTVITGGYSPVLLINDRVKVVIANGGIAKTGTFYVNLSPAE